MEKTIRGTVERIVFHNDQNGWTVVILREDAAGAPRLRSVTGVIDKPRLGMALSCTGEEATGKYGPFFKSSAVVEVVPSDREGIEKYLSSGLIRNIGPVSARAIVEAFGEDTLRVLDDEPERLKEVRGIGRKRVESIIESVKEQRDVRDIMIWLKRYDLSNGLAAKIYMAYGHDAISKLEENPYRLSDDIKGVGFKKADDVALRLGVARDSAFRIRSGIMACLEDAAGEGHTFLPRCDLLSRVSGNDYLGLDEGLVDGILDEGFDDVRMSADGGVALAYYDRAEKAIASKLAALLAAPCPDLSAGFDVEAEERRSGLSYSGSQRAAMDGVLRSAVSVITGGPGTGKTSITKAIIGELARQGREVLLAAPTGRAAKRLAAVTGHPARTVHMLLEAGPEGFRRNASNPLEGDALIVDESSMIDTVLMRSLLTAVPEGMRLVFVGDIDQLPSVGAGSVLRDIINSGAVPSFRLTEIFRQAMDSQIVMNAHRINRGAMIKTGNDIFNGDMFFFNKEGRDEAADTVVRLATTGVTRKFGYRPEDIQVLSPMRRDGDPISASTLNRRLQAILNPDGAVAARNGDMEFRIGDRVMQTKNDYRRCVFNGDMGTVREKVPAGAEDNAVLVAAFDGGEVRYTQADLAGLTLAYACTVHKSQGMEYPVVVMPVHDSHYVLLKRNLLYTAVTRAKRLCVLVGTKKAIATAIAREDTFVRHTRLKERIGEAMGRKEISAGDMELFPDPDISGVPRTTLAPPPTEEPEYLGAPDAPSDTLFPERLPHHGAGVKGTPAHEKKSPGRSVKKTIPDKAAEITISRRFGRR